MVLLKNGVPIFLVIAFVITYSWTRFHFQVAYAETGLLYWSLQSSNSFGAWQQSLGTGIPLLQPLSSGLWGEMMEGLIVIGVPSFGRQAALWFLTLFLSGFSAYYLVRCLGQGVLTSVVSGVFYMLNPFAMVEVWKRFIPATFFMLPLVPFTIAFCIQGLKTGQSAKYALLIGIVSAALAPAYGEPAFILAFWFIVLSMYSLGLLLLIPPTEARSKRLRFLPLIALSWMATNLWWLLPFWDASRTLSFANGIPVDFGTLASLSRFDGLAYSLRLIVSNSSSYSPSYLWSGLYSGVPFVVASFAIPIISFSSLLLQPRNKFVLLMSSMGIIGLFLSKGLADPFGSVFGWLFLSVPYVSLWRNPFEKLGLIIAAAYSFLYSACLSSLWNIEVSGRRRLLASKISRVTLVALILIANLVLFALPIWSGAVFTDTDRPRQNPLAPDIQHYFVSVPSYYSDANAWIISHIGQSRILVLPLSPLQGNSYKWPSGYSGIDPAYALFDSPTISTSSYGTQLDKIVQLVPQYVAEGLPLWKVLSMLNVRYVVLNGDVNTPLLSEVAGTLVPDLGFWRTELVDPVIPANISSESINRLYLWYANRSGWSLSQGTEGTVFVENISGIPTVSVSAIPSDGYVSAAYAVPTNSSDWTNSNLITFTFRTKVTTEGLFRIIDSQRNSLAFDFYVGANPDQWSSISLRLDAPNAGTGSGFDYGHIQNLYLGVVGPAVEPITFQAANFSLSQQVDTGGYDLSNPTLWSRFKGSFSTFQPLGDRNETTLALLGVPDLTNTIAVVAKIPQADRDWSMIRYLAFNMRSNVSAPIVVQLIDSKGSTLQWNGNVIERFHTYQSNTSEDFVMSLQGSTYETFGGSFNSKDVREVIVALGYPEGRPISWSLSSMQAQIGKQVPPDGIAYAKTFGQLEIFEVNQSRVSPMVYSATKYQTTDNYQTLLFKVIGSPTFRPGRDIAFLLTEPTNLKSNLPPPSSGQGIPPVINLVSSNEYSYHITIENASFPFFLVLSNTYNSGWGAYFGSFSFGEGVSVPAERHYTANGFANAWYVDRLGSYSMTLYFHPQYMFWIGIPLSLGITIILVASLPQRMRTNILMLISRAKHAIVLRSFKKK